MRNSVMSQGTMLSVDKTDQKSLDFDSEGPYFDMPRVALQKEERPSSVGKFSAIQDALKGLKSR